MYFSTEEGEFIEVNQAFVEFSGYSQEELQDMDVFDLVVDKDRRSALVDEVKEKGHIDDELLLIQNKNGEIKVCKDTAVKVLLDDGTVGFQGMLDDVTDVIETEKQLKLLQRAVEHSVNIVIITDANGIIEYVNQQFSKTTGYRKEEVIGKNPRILNSGRLDDTVYQELWKTISSGMVWKGVFYNKTKSGDYYWARSTISPVFGRDGKKITHYIDVQENINQDVEYKREIIQVKEERDQLEKKLLQNEKLQIIAQLVGGIAHDFNNILTIIESNADFLNIQTDDEQIHEIGRDIKSAAVRGSNLIKRLLNYSRTSKFERKVVDFKEIFEEIKKILFGVVKDKINLNYEFQAERTKIVTDLTALESVLVNIVMNSQDAIDGEGNIDILVKNSTFNEEKPISKQDTLCPGEYLVIEIRDDGEGMDPEILEKVFEPFFSTKSDGIGLGMANAYNTIKSLNGLIGASSTPSEGTTMTVYLPVVSENEQTNTKPITQYDIDHILVIDDEKLVLKSFERVFSPEFAKLSVYSDPGAAVSYYREYMENIDLVILDLDMPNIHGGEVLKHLHAMNPDVKAIIYSGFITEEVYDLREYGAIEFVSKPTEMDRLLDLIKQFQK